MAFAYKKSLTLAEAQSGTADSTNWPLTIALDGVVQAADADLKTVANGGFVQDANGYDIRPYSDSALTSALTYELVYYQATTGKLEMHVLIPTLSSSTDTVIYLAFGDAALNTDGSSTSTWNSAYKAVWHWPDGTTLASLDSTAGNNDGTIANATAVAGAIDGAADFNGTTAQIEMANETNFDFERTDTFTISTWIKGTADPTTTQSIYAKQADNGGSDQGIIIAVGGTVAGDPYRIRLNSSGTSGIEVRFPRSNDTNWHHIAVTYSGSSAASGVLMYLDSVAQTPTVSVDNLTTTILNNTVVSVGYRKYTASLYFVGSLDEMRVSNVVRAQSWITAEYNAEKASSTFITWGARTSTTATGKSSLSLLGIT